MPKSSAGRLPSERRSGSIYGMVGVLVTVENIRTTASSPMRHQATGFSYGAGLRFSPDENVALDFSYEQSRIRNVDVGTWIAGVGYRF